METITDTMSSEIIESITRYYERKGYQLRSMKLLSSDRYEVVYEKAV